MKTIRHLDKALQNIDYENLILLGDFNVNYKHPKNQRSADIVNLLQTYKLRNLAKDYKPRRNKSFKWSWRRYQDGERIQSLCNYIMYGTKTEWKSFNMINMDFDSDHCLLKGKMISKVSRKHHRYVKIRSNPQVEMFPSGDLNEALEIDKKLKYLKELLPRNGETKPKNRSWILKTSFDLLHQKTKALRIGDSTEINRIGRELRRSIRQDRRKRVWETSIEVEQNLERGDIIGAFKIMRNWY